MGGTVAYLFAERYPDRLVKIVIEDTAPPEEPPTPRPVPELTPEAFESFDQLVGRLKDQPGAPPEPELRELIRPAITQRADGRWIRRLDPALLPAIFAELNDPDPGWWEELHRITAPTLLVLGQQQLGQPGGGRSGACRHSELPRRHGAGGRTWRPHRPARRVPEHGAIVPSVGASWALSTSLLLP
jgi:pimeloyl-ACP methyl ester carboxylesterase